jgi:hypothetical protein
VKTNLPERDTLLVTPKVFTKQAPGRAGQKANGG